MAKFVLAYKGGQMASSEAEQQAVMAAWGKWFGSLGSAVVDPGNPFGESASVAADRSVKTDAPSALTGYSILAADSLKAAIELAKGCPVLRSGGAVEVYEAFDVM